MSRIQQLIILVSTTAFLASLQARAAEEAATKVTARADIISAYVWRGITVNEGWVVQPSLDIATPSGVGLNVWGNVNLDDYDGRFQENEFGELDPTITYAFSVGPVSLTVGVLEYLYPHQVTTSGSSNAVHTGATPGTRELMAKAETQVMETLSVSASFYYDADEYDDFYANIGLKYAPVIIKDKLSAEMGALVGYAGKDWAVGNSLGTKGGFHEWNVYAAATVKLTAQLDASANLGYTDTLDKDVLPEQDTNLYGGVSLSTSF